MFEYSEINFKIMILFLAYHKARSASIAIYIMAFKWPQNTKYLHTTLLFLFNLNRNGMLIFLSNTELGMRAYIFLMTIFSIFLHGSLISISLFPTKTYRNIPGNYFPDNLSIINNYGKNIYRTRYSMVVST